MVQYRLHSSRCHFAVAGAKQAFASPTSNSQVSPPPGTIPVGSQFGLWKQPYGKLTAAPFRCRCWDRCIVAVLVLKNPWIESLCLLARWLILAYKQIESEEEYCLQYTKILNQDMKSLIILILKFINLLIYLASFKKVGWETFVVRVRFHFPLILIKRNL